MYHQEKPVYVVITNYLQISMTLKKNNRTLFFLFMILFAMLVYDSAMQADTPAVETFHT